MEKGILDPLIPHLTSISYGHLLCTCKHIRDNFDYKTEWKKRSPETNFNIKKHAMIKQGIDMYGAKVMLGEVHTIKRLNILLRSYKRLIKPLQLVDMYFQHLHSDECRFPNLIRIEKCRLHYTCGNKIKSRKRKYIRHSNDTASKKRHLHHMIRAQLRLDR